MIARGHAFSVYRLGLRAWAEAVVPPHVEHSPVFWCLPCRHETRLAAVFPKTPKEKQVEWRKWVTAGGRSKNKRRRLASFCEARWLQLFRCYFTASLPSTKTGSAQPNAGICRLLWLLKPAPTARNHVVCCIACCFTLSWPCTGQLGIASAAAPNLCWYLSARHRTPTSPAYRTGAHVRKQRD